MWTRKPLPPDVEAALDTLEKTTIFAEGEAAKQTAEKHFRKLQWSQWLFLVPYPLFFIPRDLVPVNLALHLSVFGLGLLLALLVYDQFRRISLSIDVYQSAMNRWRQIAATLAVSGKAQ